MGANPISRAKHLRAARKSESDLGRKVAAIMDSGALVSDQIVNELVEEEIKKNPNQVGPPIAVLEITRRRSRFLSGKGNE